MVIWASFMYWTMPFLVRFFHLKCFRLWIFRQSHLSIQALCELSEYHLYNIFTTYNPHLPTIIRTSWNYLFIRPSFLYLDITYRLRSAEKIWAHSFEYINFWDKMQFHEPIVTLFTMMSRLTIFTWPQKSVKMKYSG